MCKPSTTCSIDFPKFATMKSCLWSVLIAFFVGGAWAQPANNLCEQAMNLCPSVSYSASNQGATFNACAGCADGASQAGNFCFPLNNTVWFTFTTNNTGGNASVSISGITCQAGTTNGLEAVVIAAGTPCNEATYVQVGSCNAGDAPNITLPLVGLTPNTTYYVLVDGDDGGLPAGICSFNIRVTGEAVTPIINLTSTPSVCTGNTGTVSVLNVSGGVPTYEYAINGGTFQTGTGFNNLTPGTHNVLVNDANGCIFQASTSVAFQNPPTAGIVVTNQASCNGSDGSLELVGTANGTAPYSFSINNGPPQPSPQFTGLSAGYYQIIVTDANGCQDTIMGSVAGSGGFTQSLASSTPSNCSGNNGSITVTQIGSVPPYQFSLNGGPPQGSNTFNNVAAGTYSVTISDANNCIYTIHQIAVSAGPPDQQLNLTLNANPNPVCDGSTVTATATLNGNFTSAQVAFLVNGVVVQSGVQFSYTSAFNEGDIIQAMVEATGNCLVQSTYFSNLATINVLPVEQGNISISTNSTQACAGEIVTFIAEETGCTTPVVVWFVNGLAQTIPSTLNFTTAFTQNVEVYAQVICGSSCSTPQVSNSISIDIQEVEANAGQNLVIIEGSSIQLQGSGNGTPLWSPPENLSSTTVFDPTASPLETTVYTLTVTNGGCTATDTMILFVTPPIIPTTVITPNGDGKNDTWYIQYIENYPGCRIDVYDRWGQRVYNTVGYTNANPWDGTNRGMKLPAGAYYFVIELNTGTENKGDVFTGNIALIY